MSEAIDRSLKKLAEELEGAYDKETYRRTHRRVRVLAPLLKKLARRHRYESEAHFRQVTKRVLASEMAFPGGRKPGRSRKRHKKKGLLRRLLH